MPEGDGVLSGGFGPAPPPPQVAGYGVVGKRRRDVIADLRASRADLYDRFLALGEGLDLPGDVTDTASQITG